MRTINDFKYSKNNQFVYFRKDKYSKDLFQKVSLALFNIASNLGLVFKEQNNQFVLKKDEQIYIVGIKSEINGEQYVKIKFHESPNVTMTKGFEFVVNEENQNKMSMMRAFRALEMTYIINQMFEDEDCDFETFVGHKRYPFITTVFIDENLNMKTVGHVKNKHGVVVPVMVTCDVNDIHNKLYVTVIDEEIGTGNDFLPETDEYKRYVLNKDNYKHFSEFFIDNVADGIGSALTDLMNRMTIAYEELNISQM